MDKILSERTKRRRVQEEFKIYKSETSTTTKTESNKNKISSLLNETQDEIEDAWEEVPHCVPNKIFESNSIKFSSFVPPVSQMFQETGLNNCQHNNIPLEYPHNIQSPKNLVDNETEHNLNTDRYADDIFSIRCMIAKWAIDFNIPHNAINSLLSSLRKHSCFSELPKDSRTILNTNNNSISTNNIIRSVNPGRYYHFGLKNGIINNYNILPSVSSDNPSLNIIRIAVGIDGLPISKSTSQQFWPILGYIVPNNNVVFPIGIYIGMEKPADSNDFIFDFVSEAKDLILNGIRIKNKLYSVSIHFICCDTPAKSFVLKIKGHCGFFSCTRCQIEGEYLLNRTCFPPSQSTIQPAVRTHDGYIHRVQEEYHSCSTSISCVVDLPEFNVVSNFPLDYMHMVCLGTMKKLIKLWMRGPLSVRLPSHKIHILSGSIKGLKSSFPCEFSRKPRGLDEIARWKATELRTFLLYVGPIVLKDMVSNNCFKHFMSLNVAMIILLSPNFSSYLQYARDLLKYFVEMFEKIYGSHLISHNIHGLIHIADDYEIYGPLDRCSAFPFENYMKKLKSMIRKPDKPLEQVINRYHESSGILFDLNSDLTLTSTNENAYKLLGPHNKGPLFDETITNPQYKSISFVKFTLKIKSDADSYFYTKQNEVVKLVNIAYSQESGNVVLVGKKFEYSESFYEHPIDSSYFDIFIVRKLSDRLNVWSISNVKNKIILFCFENKFIAVPLLH